MKFIQKNRVLFGLGMVIGVGSLCLALSIPAVHANVFGGENSEVRSTEKFLLRDTNLDTTYDEASIAAKPDSAETLALSTGWVATGLPKCGSRCTTTGCTSSGNIENDTTFSTGSSYYLTYTVVVNTNDANDPRMPTASYMQTTQPSPGKKITSISRVTTANDDGDCAEVVDGETWTFFKYSGTMD